jgi:hypothetical protein
VSQVKVSEDVKKQLLEIVREVALSGSLLDELLSKRIVDLNIDSLALMQINLEFESQHSLRLDINDIDGSTTIDQMISKLISTLD